VPVVLPIGRRRSRNERICVKSPGDAFFGHRQSPFIPDSLNPLQPVPGRTAARRQGSAAARSLPPAAREGEVDRLLGRPADRPRPAVPPAGAYQRPVPGGQYEPSGMTLPSLMLHRFWKIARVTVYDTVRTEPSAKQAFIPPMCDEPNPPDPLAWVEPAG
jgi:hypothetical protein